jgi:hypothetical protein
MFFFSRVFMIQFSTFGKQQLAELTKGVRVSWHTVPSQPQEVSGGNGFVLMIGAELVELYQVHGFQVFDAIPFALFWPL